MGLLDRIFRSASPATPAETAADRQAWLDRTITAAASQVQVHMHAAIRQAARSFEAAETPAWTDSWPTHCGAINQDLQMQLPTLIARARGIARNNEWAIKYLADLHDNTCGDTGIRMQSRLKKPGPAGKPISDPDANTALEALWEKFWSRPDVAGYTGRQLEDLALNALETDGAILYRLRPGAGPLGFQIQLLPVTLLDTTLNRDWGTNRIRMGIEINNDNAPVAYWLLLADPNDSPTSYITVGRHVRIPAAEIRHYYHVQEVGQLRGVPGLVNGARRIWLTKAFEESAAVASINAARREGFFKSIDGEAPSGFADQIVSATLDAAKAAGKELTPEEVRQIMAAAEKYNTTMPGQFDTLPQGYDFTPFESKWPNVSAEGFVKSHLRAWCSARGVSYTSIGNDLESVNYSSAQVGMTAERYHYQRLQADLIAWLHASIFEVALPYLLLRAPGTLKYNRLPDYLAAAAFQGRRWEPIDPHKGAAANEILLRAKLISRRRIWLNAAQDPDEMQAEIDEDIARNGPIASPNQPAPTAAHDPADGSADPAKTT